MYVCLSKVSAIDRFKVDAAADAERRAKIRQRVKQGYTEKRKKYQAEKAALKATQEVLSEVRGAAMLPFTCQFFMSRSSEEWD